MMKRFFILVAILGLISGCAHSVSRDVLKEVDRTITFSALLKAPNDYQGRMVLLGGIIVSALNKQEGTLLEVYQTRIDREGRPADTDRSEGRFLALYLGFLDSEIYKKGREVTIAGTVQGEKTQLLGQIKYRYPYLIAKEIRLWEEVKAVPYEPYWLRPGYDPYPWGWYDPWGPWGWYYPRWHHWHRHH